MAFLCTQQFQCIDLLQAKNRRFISQQRYRKTFTLSGCSIVFACQSGNGKQFSGNDGIPSTNLDGELKFLAEEGVRNHDISLAAEPIVHRTAESGVQQIENIAGQVKDSLKDVENKTESYASSLAEEEIDKVLNTYREKQKLILDEKAKHIKTIREESQRITELCGELKEISAGNKFRRDHLATQTLVVAPFLLAAVYYTLCSISGNAEVNIRNAVINLVISAMGAYFVTRRK